MDNEATSITVQKEKKTDPQIEAQVNPRVYQPH